MPMVQFLAVATMTITPPVYSYRISAYMSKALSRAQNFQKGKQTIISYTNDGYGYGHGCNHK